MPKGQSQRKVQIRKGSRRTKVNLSNTYGIKPSGGGLGKPTVTTTQKGKPLSRDRALGKITGGA